MTPEERQILFKNVSDRVFTETTSETMKEYYSTFIKISIAVLDEYEKLKG